ncbi:DJ-1 family protein [Puniceicoccales bacterium CK1056]|uniref:DJ-1 family protein n=1 Tax=Oceanipulchritudo coccoides TaxID=2706888 RepID=A0A6B2M1Z8_9BACT|nr:DJ-1 family glyoxalase III [Oceanipulchritudo coccoides]NDV62107.1 DJ-1 family protein [Oceanipulchritudo coccoides]
MSNALVIIMEGVEELEAIAPVDLLRRAGATVTVASASSSLEIIGRNGIRVTADMPFAEAEGKAFDLVVVPGGPGHADLLEHKGLLDLLVRQNTAGRLIGSICAGPVVLNQAGVLEGKKFTSFPGTADLLPDRDAQSAVVVDGNIITSQGAGTALVFALALIKALFGQNKRDEIADSICFSD